MKLHVGTSGYSYKEWKGLFYPATLSPKKMLGFYGQHFGAVEINYTFRGALTHKLLESWSAEVPADFKFVLKAPQRVTHIQRLKNTAALVAEFHAIAATLGQRSGPLLFQLPPNLKKDAALLKSFLEILPKNCRSTIEFRHQSWFDDDVLALLREFQVALCIAEAENDLQVPFVSTADWGYIRLRRSDYSDAELRVHLAQFREQNWSDAYVFFRHEDEAKGPVMATRLLELAR